MRKNSVIDALFSRRKGELLAIILADPQRAWFVSELAGKVGARPSSLQRDLAKLTAAEVLTRREDGNRVYYHANAGCPVLTELRRLFAKTSGIVSTLRTALEPVQDRIKLAVVHGSFARGDETAESDVDLVVIGDIGLADLAFPLRAAREESGREISISVYRPEEFRRKIESGHSFLLKFLERDMLFVIGARNDLDEIAGREAGRARDGDQGRTGRP